MMAKLFRRCSAANISRRQTAAIRIVSVIGLQGAEFTLEWYSGHLFWIRSSNIQRKPITLTSNLIWYVNRILWYFDFSKHLAIESTRSIFQWIIHTSAIRTRNQQYSRCKRQNRILSRNILVEATARAPVRLFRILLNRFGYCAANWAI